MCIITLPLCTKIKVYLYLLPILHRLMNVELKMWDNVTNPTLYAYILDPLRLVKVGNDYKLYYFKQFIVYAKLLVAIATLWSQCNKLTRGWVIIH